MSTVPERDSENSRKAFTLELLKRQVLADHAESLGYRESPKIKQLIRITENIGIAEEYVRWNSNLQIDEPTDEEIVEAFRRLNTEVELTQIFARNEDQINLYAKQIARGANFDSLATESMKKVQEPAEAANLGWVKWNQLGLDPEIIAFQLQNGGISKPVQSANGWHIFKATNKKETFFADRSTFENNRQSIKDAIKRREVLEWSETFTGNIMRGQTIEMYPANIMSLWSAIRAGSAKQPDRISPLSGSSELLFSEEYAIRPEDIIASLNGRTITADEFFTYLSTYPASILEINPRQAVELVLQDIALGDLGRSTGQYDSDRVQRKVDITRRQILVNHLIEDRLLDFNPRDHLDYGFSKWRSLFASETSVTYAVANFNDSLTAVNHLPRLSSGLFSQFDGGSGETFEMLKDSSGIEWQKKATSFSGDMSFSSELAADLIRVLVSSIETQTPVGPIASGPGQWSIYVPLERTTIYPEREKIENELLEIIESNERLVVQELILQEIGFSESEVEFNDDLLRSILPFY